MIVWNTEGDLGPHKLGGETVVVNGVSLVHGAEIVSIVGPWQEHAAWPGASHWLGRDARHRLWRFA
jgi:hypothetical protein